jgi:hypothetical protein
MPGSTVDHHPGTPGRLVLLTPSPMGTRYGWKRPSMRTRVMPAGAEEVGP